MTVEQIRLIRPISLSKRKLLLVEGRDDSEFFSALFTRIGGMSDTQILEYGGKDKFRGYLNTLMSLRGFDAVTTIGITRDADENANDAFASVQNALISKGLPAPSEPLMPSNDSPTTTIAIVPPGETTGELEDLLLSSVATDPAIYCVDDYIGCLASQGLKLPNKLSKARLHTFLASREHPNLLIGQAARAGYFVWDSPPFVSVIQFLKNL